MKNLGQMMKQAQAMQERMAEMQAELERIEMTGQAGGGMVRVTLNGKGDMRAIKIDPKLIVPAEVEVVPPTMSVFSQSTTRSPSMVPTSAAVIPAAARDDATRAP